MDYQSHSEKESPNQDPPYVPVMHNKAPPPLNGLNQDMAPPPLSAASTEMDKLIQVLQHLTMSQQTFQQQVNHQLNHLTAAVNVLTHIAQGANVPNVPGWPSPNQAAPTASPYHVLVESLTSDVASSKGYGPSY